LASEQGIVLRTDSGSAWVKTTRSSACKGCTSRDSCHTMDGKEMEVKALNPAGAGVGDRIVLNIENGSLLKATFLIYVFPILFLVAGAVIGQLLAPLLALNPSALSALLGFALFFLSVLMMKKKAGKMANKREYQPKITKILPY
jgi:sigma-E factor negative regulatory protein RseC